MVSLMDLVARAAIGCAILAFWFIIAMCCGENLGRVLASTAKKVAKKDDEKAEEQEEQS